jgi:hypothetical protein
LPDCSLYGYQNRITSPQAVTGKRIFRSYDLCMVPEGTATVLHVFCRNTMKSNLMHRNDQYKQRIL